MRKLFLGFAALSLLVGASSCQRETTETVKAGDGSVSFRTALGKQTATKAEEFKYWADGGKVNVYAYPNGYTALSNKFELVYTAATSTWSYSPIYYQPGTPLRYYSVYPESAAITTAPVVTGTDYSFGYTVNAAVASQEDLVGASVAATTDEQINLEYDHLLSQVNFAVQGIPAASIVIGDIAVANMKNSDTYSFATGWSGSPTGTASYTYVPDADVLEILAEGTGSGIQYLGNGGGTYTYDNALMLMPQEFTAADNGTFSFTFSLAVDLDGDGDFTDETQPDAGDGVVVGAKVWATDVPVTVNFNDFDQTTWDPGKRYVYVIDFSSYIAGGPITFTVKVLDWEDDGAGNTEADIAQTVQVANVNKLSVEAAIQFHSDANAANDALAIFPINIPEAITAAFTITNIYGFDAGDVIRIECLDNDEAQKVGSAVNGWTPSIAGRVVTLTCVTPTIKGASAIVDLTDVTDDTELVTAIEAAITGLGADDTAGSFTEYTVTVGMNFTAAATIAPAGTYATGDVIRLVFPVAETNTITATGWTVTTDGAVVVLTKD